MSRNLSGFTRVALLIIVFALAGCSGNNSGKKNSEIKTNGAADTTKTGLEIGDRAPELAYASPDGKIIALSELRGKVVLIDFWAAWCMPCRIENPNLVQVYNNYKDKKLKGGDGFTIYSVSLDLNKESWTEAIKSDKLSWEAHVSDLLGWKSVPASQYQVVSIPANFLINGDGIIIAKNLRAEALEQAMRGLLEDV
jgi:thiol-disulfide isomerase/thioredoxin